MVHLADWQDDDGAILGKAGTVITVAASDYDEKEIWLWATTSTGKEGWCPVNYMSIP